MFQHLIQAIDDAWRPSQRTPAERELFQFDNETIERLENRTMLAGDVSVVVTSAGDLKLTGTSDSNQVRVQANAAGTIEVTGLTGTTVNGVNVFIPPITTPFNVERNLIVNMKGGNDYVEVESLFVQGDMRFRTGTGDDTVGVIDSIIGDDLIVNTGSGADVVAVVQGGVNGKLSIVTGSGGDAVGIQTCVNFSGPAMIRTGSGVDGVYLGGTFNDALKVNMGGGDDVLAIQANANGDRTRISLGGGNDQVFVHSNTSMLGGLPRVIGGGGNDIVDVNNGSLFVPDLRAVEISIITFGADASVDNAGLAFVVLYTLRGGDPTDLGC